MCVLAWVQCIAGVKVNDSTHPTYLTAITYRSSGCWGTGLVSNQPYKTLNKLCARALGQPGTVATGTCGLWMLQGLGFDHELKPYEGRHASGYMPGCRVRVGAGCYLLHYYWVAVKMGSEQVM